MNAYEARFHSTDSNSWKPWINGSAFICNPNSRHHECTGQVIGINGDNVRLMVYASDPMNPRPYVTEKLANLMPVTAPPSNDD